jgi:glutamyl-tRNA(Gln) amidotransferase subunit E
MKIKCGFEWHVQLNTGKLFCRCKPKIHEEADADMEIRRRFRSSFGESGKIDESAMFEVFREKQIVYKVFKDSDCLVDLDEEPPHDVDKEALETAVNACSALSAEIQKNIIFMRKVIVDGSNTSGFQRTAVIGINGIFRFGNKDIKIRTICLEEDSARKESETSDSIVYKLDRLGIPLLEFTTEPIDTDESEAKEIALAFGRFTRLLNVRRGIGTIRQDINISIEGGSRIEMKGFQNIREMDKAILNEAGRQKTLITMAKNYGYLLREYGELKSLNLSRLLANSNSKILSGAVAKDKIVLGIKMGGLKGVLGNYVEENKTFGGEISDYLHASYGGGIIHSDELPNYGITEAEVENIRGELSVGESDAFILSIVDKAHENIVATEIKNRVNSLLSSVPSEVRSVQSDNTTKFLRPIGGKDRMYVETDLPIIRIDEEVLRAGKRYSDLSVEKLEKEYGLSGEFIDLLIGVNKLNLALELNKKLKLPFSVIVKVLVDDYRYIRRKFDFTVDNGQLEVVLDRISKDSLARDASSKVLENLALGNGKSVDEVIERFRLKKVTDVQLEDEIEHTLSAGGINRPDVLITNLREKLGFSFDASDAYKIASNLLKKNG